jgi:hypothetical protein
MCVIYSYFPTTVNLSKLFLHFMPRQPDFMLLGIWRAMRYADILAQDLVRHILALLIRAAVSGIGNERHFCHLVDRDGREVVVHLNGPQQQVTPAAKKGILFPWSPNWLVRLSIYRSRRSEENKTGYNRKEKGCIIHPLPINMPRNLLS